jgi:hypothetical protein
MRGIKLACPMLKNLKKNFTATNSQKSTRFYWSENPNVIRYQIYFWSLESNYCSLAYENKKA